MSGGLAMTPGQSFAFAPLIQSRAFSATAAASLDRIRFDRTRIVGSIDPVNPVYTYKVEQIHGR